MGIFGPAAGAFYSLRTLDGKGAVGRYLRCLLDLRFGWKAWILPLVVLGGSTCVSWAIPELWGERRLGILLPSLWVFPVYLLAMVFFGGGQEELGWRGYILDPIEARLGPWLGNLALGIIWAVWHLPLSFVPGTTETYMSFPGVLEWVGSLHADVGEEAGIRPRFVQVVDPDPERVAGEPVMGRGRVDRGEWRLL